MLARGVPSLNSPIPGIEYDHGISAHGHCSRPIELPRARAGPSELADHATGRIQDDHLAHPAVEDVEPAAIVHRKIRRMAEEFRLR
jgi:hypothetical protein